MDRRNEQRARCGVSGHLYLLSAGRLKLGSYVYGANTLPLSYDPSVIGRVIIVIVRNGFPFILLPPAPV